MFIEDDVEGIEAAELTKKTLIDTQERMGMMLDVMPMGLLIHTRQGILFANQEACRLLQVSQPEAIGHHFLDFLTLPQVSKVALQIENAFDGKLDIHRTESTITRSDGSELTIKLIAGRLPWQGNPVIQLLLQDITDLKRTEQTLRRLTITDELTGAYNRRHAFYEAALYIDPARSPAIPLSVILLDIDHFKRVNDTYGHAVGDIVLKGLTLIANEIIRASKNPDAIFARIGGEEFLLLLPGTPLSAAELIAETLRLAIERKEFVGPQGAFGITVSMGLALYAPTDGNFDTLLSRTDVALYAAKQAGRNRVVISIQ